MPKNGFHLLNLAFADAPFPKSMVYRFLAAALAGGPSSVPCLVWLLWCPPRGPQGPLHHCTDFSARGWAGSVSGHGLEFPNWDHARENRDRGCSVELGRREKDFLACCHRCNLHSGPRLIPSDLRWLTEVPKLGAWSLQGPLAAPAEEAGEGEQGLAGAALLLPTAEGALPPILGAATAPFREKERGSWCWEPLWAWHRCSQPPPAPRSHRPLAQK